MFFRRRLEAACARCVGQLTLRLACPKTFVAHTRPILVIVAIKQAYAIANPTISKISAHHSQVKNREKNTMCDKTRVSIDMRCAGMFEWRMKLSLGDQSKFTVDTADRFFEATPVPRSSRGFFFNFERPMTKTCRHPEVRTPPAPFFHHGDVWCVARASRS